MFVRDKIIFPVGKTKLKVQVNFRENLYSYKFKLKGSIPCFTQKTKHIHRKLSSKDSATFAISAIVLND